MFFFTALVIKIVLFPEFVSRSGPSVRGLLWLCLSYKALDMDPPGTVYVPRFLTISVHFGNCQFDCVFEIGICAFYFFSAKFYYVVVFLSLSTCSM